MSAEETAIEIGSTREKRWVTTVIPTFERAELLRRAVLSVLNQTYCLTCVSVFDNLSRDATESTMAELAAKYPGRVKYHKNEVNIGSLLNFDRAIRSVETPYFTIMSDDDVLLPGFIESALGQLDEHPSADIACGRTWGISPDGQVLNGDPLGFATGVLDAPKGAELMLRYRHPDWQGMLFRSKVLERCPCLNPQVEGFDVDFVIRCAALYGIVFFESDAALFLRHKDSATFDLKLKYIYPSYQKMLESIEADPFIVDPFKSFARKEIPRVLERALRHFIIREAVENSPRDLELAIKGLLENGDSPRNRRLAMTARLLQRSRLLRMFARSTIKLWRRRTQVKLSSVARSYNFADYVRV
jgi:glycosyltransferase involved in cell wall biosynthesis